jgi:nicotinate-nucleotide--dimethylbenzimidazole phosphoribosyltransferase
MELLKKVTEGIKPADREMMRRARERVDNLTKPLGSLGRLEEMAVRLCGITGSITPDVGKKAVIVMAADNGVCSEGVAAYPQQVTALMAKAMVEGTAGVAVFANLLGADLKVFDLGMKEPVDYKGIINKRIRPGTANIAEGPAMTRDEAVRAIETGIQAALDAADSGYRMIAVGEVGIGNTTTGSAVFAALEGLNPSQTTGRGAGLDDAGLSVKIRVVERALEINKPDPGDAVDVLGKVGGLDIAGMAGVFLGAAYRRIPVVMDGFISSVAALAAIRLNPLAAEYVFPSHLSAEKGGGLVLERLGIKPCLDLEMRLGEGSGAVLMFGIIEAAAAALVQMKTFEEAGIKRNV